MMTVTNISFFNGFMLKLIVALIVIPPLEVYGVNFYWTIDARNVPVAVQSKGDSFSVEESDFYIIRVGLFAKTENGEAAVFPTAILGGGLCRAFLDADNDSLNFDWSNEVIVIDGQEYSVKPLHTSLGLISLTNNGEVCRLGSYEVKVGGDVWRRLQSSQILAVKISFPQEWMRFFPSLVDAGQYEAKKVKGNKLFSGESLQIKLRSSWKPEDFILDK